MSEVLKAEIEKEDAEIEALRAKAEERRKRQEEDLRKQEEEKARIEAEKLKREEEERRRKEEVAAKKRQAELNKLNQQTKVIEQEMVSLGEAGGSKLSNVLKAKEDMQKSPEQLEKEKREIISSRLIKLNLDGQSKSDLISSAQELYNTLLSLHSQIYDLTEKHDRQKYDMMELAERARQIEKGKAKTRKSNIVHTGLGGSVFPWLTETVSQAPQKISLFSRYERVTDRRTFKDRRDLWAITKEKKEVTMEKPKAKIKQIDLSESSTFKKKGKKTRQVEEEKPAAEETSHHEEAPPAEEEEAPEAEEAAPEEEEAHAEEEEEAPAEED